ncbi:hypothetical protein GYMLUDRAFT_78056 [Collybiopsis luxurians FD-317 M1]|uniref:Uncharacterized protein n=1 Tax=Collybiopsis luxurians FD-317 M1 TaxID=944289 RepID=A0A0D0CAI7_9AGAR|nr:hypothetical protein GYMLUDRAFT_78056 [Collybiopsis luxurians FD-317 M1]
MSIVNEADEKHKHSCLLLDSSNKSTFLVYFLAIQLSLAKPTFFYNGVTAYFDKTGAYQVFSTDQDDYTPFLNFHHTMCLLDSDHNAVPPKFWLKRGHLFMVLASSPKETQYKEYKKHQYLSQIIAKPPTFHEAMHVALLQDTWDTYSPNLCLGAAVVLDGQQAIDKYYQKLEEAIFVVHSYSMVECPMVLKHCIHSGMIMCLLIQAAEKKKLRDRGAPYQFFSLSLSTAPSLDYLFEILGIEKLAGGYSSTLWSLEGRANLPLSLAQLPIIFFNNQSHSDATKKHRYFYVPLQKNNSIYNAFCYQDGMGLGFQKTISKSHTIKKPGLLALHQRLCTAGVSQCIFIIITPKDTNFKLPTDLECLNKKPHFEFYKLELDFLPAYDMYFWDFFESGCVELETDAMQID